jgi:hypothetical protein
LQVTRLKTSFGVIGRMAHSPIIGGIPVALIGTAAITGRDIYGVTDLSPSTNTLDKPS